MVEKKAKAIRLNQVKIKDKFWSPKQEMIIEQVIPYQQKILDDQIEGAEKSHAFANFRIAAGLEQGEFYGMIFQDSDVAKWLEAAAYALSIRPDKALENRADNIIDVIEKAQQEDGYLNTYFTIKEPERRWENLHECHELYCAGHMMEAAGLLRMYETTGKEKYKKLASYFIDERGKNPDYFMKETEQRGWSHQGMYPLDVKYNQTYAPVREQVTAEGHSVRAVYMYTAMAELSGINKDEALYKACHTIWDNMVNKRMYITAGIGSTVKGEAFTVDYDLPSDTVYAETCTSVALCFIAKKMLEISPHFTLKVILKNVMLN